MIDFIILNIYYSYVGAIIIVAVGAAILFVWPKKPIDGNTFFRLK